MKTQETPLQNKGNSRIYRRENMDSLKPTQDRSLIYSRAQARAVFQRFPEVGIVEYVNGGRKTDSQIIGKGAELAPSGCYVIISSTGGKWGKSRRDFQPVKA